MGFWHQEFRAEARRAYENGVRRAGGPPRPGESLEQAVARMAMAGMRKEHAVLLCSETIIDVTPERVAKVWPNPNGRPVRG